MSTMEFNPQKEMRKLQKKMNIFDGPNQMHKINIFRPNVNIKESGNSIIITFELPGINKDHVSVEVTKDNTLVVSGEKKSSYSSSSSNTNSANSIANSTTTTTTTANSNSNNISTPSSPSTPNNSNSNNSNNSNATTTTIRKFIRSFKLGSGVDGSKIKATMDDGLLVIEIPKAETEKIKVPILSRL